ncbi:ribonuclease H-like domain-containing protein [Mycena floridula]|nr:ribonuclease H-like domain-containing protein [Mycena floridula]
MPFGKEETKAFQDQALRAVISANLPFSVFENPEVKVLFGMARTTAPAKLPSGKVVAGRLLTKAANLVQAKLEKVLKGQEIRLNTDGWKSHTKASVNGICANYNYKLYTLDLVEVTAQKKDGLAQCEQFAKMIDDTEEKYDCIVIYLTTDADGGSNKGRKLLLKKRAYLILPSCWAHQSQLILGDYFKVNTLAAQIAEDATALLGWLNNHGRVRKIFDESQAAISSDRLKRIIILSYLVANLTRWTAHYVAFMRLLHLKDALQLAVITHRRGIIEAQVGTAKAREKDHLEEEANVSCDRIMNGMFWNGLENLCGDIEPVCYATNINQKDSTRADQVLLTLIGMYLHFAAHPEPEVARDMCKRLEKRWADCDQLLFLLCLVLNPFESLSCFGTEANFSNYKLRSMIVEMYRRMSARPDNTDTDEQCKKKETEVSAAFMEYISGTGEFGEWTEYKDDEPDKDPVRVWENFKGNSKLRELATFAIRLLKVVVNQAGCEHLFSDVHSDIKDEHQKKGLIKDHAKRKNHSSTEKLLLVPRYSELLNDFNNEDESERGRVLVSTAQGWRTEMAKWIGSESDNDDEEPDQLPRIIPVTKWKQRTLESLFKGAPKPPPRIQPTDMEIEAELMQALAEQQAEQDEDDIPDDGAIEVDSDEEYHG